MYGIRGSAANKYADDNDIIFIDRRYDLSDAIVAGIEKKVWKKSGATQKPTVTLRGTKLKEGRDYTLSYRKNKEVGLAEVRINSAGNYDGFCIRKFKINPKQVTGLKLTAGKNELKAIWKEEKGETLSGYELQYSSSANFKNDAATMTIGKDVFRVFAAALGSRDCRKTPGTILHADGRGIEIACGKGESVLITELQAPGKKRMKAADFLRGHPITEDKVS